MQSQLLVNRTKRKRRKKRTEKELAPTGSERVKVINMKTGKKVRKNILFLTKELLCISTVQCGYRNGTLF